MLSQPVRIDIATDSWHGLHGILPAAKLDTSGFCLALLYVSKRVYSEASSLFYSENCFTLPDLQSPPDIHAKVRFSPRFSTASAARTQAFSTTSASPSRPSMITTSDASRSKKTVYVPWSSSDLTAQILPHSRRRWRPRLQWRWPLIRSTVRGPPPRCWRWYMRASRLSRR